MQIPQQRLALFLCSRDYRQEGVCLIFLHDAKVRSSVSDCNTDTQIHIYTEWRYFIINNWVKCMKVFWNCVVYSYNFCQPYVETLRFEKTKNIVSLCTSSFGHHVGQYSALELPVLRLNSIIHDYSSFKLSKQRSTDCKTRYQVPVVLSEGSVSVLRTNGIPLEHVTHR